MQVDPLKPKLKPPGSKRLKLKCDTLLSTSAFKFNLRRYTLALEMREKIAGATSDSAEAVREFAVAGGAFNGSYMQRGREAGAPTRQLSGST